MHFVRQMRRRLRKRLKALGLHSDSGIAALEFALVGPFFIFFVCVIIDLGLLLFTQSVLNNAARDAARLIMTDQTGADPTAFANALCSETNSLISCANLQFYVQSADSFSAMDATPQLDGSGNLANNGVFSPGAPGQDVIVEVAYNRPTLLPWNLPSFDGGSGTISNASNLLVATVAFQNEP